MNISSRERIFRAVFNVPAGKVATYGQIAELAGLPRAARLVGATLKGLPADTKLPWHRVVNTRGRISLPMDGHGRVQRQRLEDEGVTFLQGRVDLANDQWRP
jgi:methylated-DNA-protein-cysteine methyltransferase-like protein